MTDHTEAVLNSLRTMERHLDSEYVDDLEETLASVSREPRFGMMPEPGVVAVISDSQGVAKFYEERAKVFTPTASRITAQLATDWYVFLENAPSRVNMKTGEETTVQTTTLFPIAADGIRGEFLWERDPSANPVSEFRLDNAVSHVPHISVRNLSVHEEFLGAIIRGDLETLASMIAPKCIWAVRNYLPEAGSRAMVKLQGIDAVLANFRAWIETFEIERISILNRLATDWYVFAEELLIVRPKVGREKEQPVQYRKASIYPINPSGSIEGELGFGTDIEPASPSSHLTLGAAFWQRIDHMRPKGPALKRRD